MNYFDLYYAYLAQCERENWINNIDPHHYKMEWNHTLPQCIFGDLPFGQWLTLKQHAIASCLQSIVFETLCHCGWHKKYVKSELWELAEKTVLQKKQIVGKQQVENKKGIHNPEKRMGYAALGGQSQGRNNVANGTGMFKRTFDELSAASKQNRARRFRCLVTDRESNDTGLTKIQNRLGIDTSLRIQIN